MTREGRRYPSGWKKYEKDATAYDTLFASLFQTAVKVKIGDNIQNDSGIKTPVTSEHILGCLYRYGNVAYDTETGLFLPYYSEGALNAYGFADKYMLYSPYNGNTQSQRRDKLYLFTANPSGTPPARKLREKALIIADIETAIQQNLDTAKECTIIKGVDENLAQKVRAADKARREGAAMVFLPEAAAQFARAEVFKVGATYLVDRLQEARRVELEDAFKLIGIKTPLEKESGVTSEEMQTQNARTSALLHILIKTCNEQAKAQGAAIEFIPADQGEEPQNENKEPTEGEELAENGKEVI